MQMLKNRVFSLLAVRGIGSLIQLLVIVILGNFYDPTMIGEYYIFLTWLYLFSIVSSLGLPIYLLKEISAQDSLNNFLLSSKVFFTALLYVVIISMSIFILFVVFLFIKPDLYLSSNTILFASFDAIFLIIIKVISETLKAKGLQNHGFFLEFVLPQSIVIVILFIYGITNQVLHISNIALFYVISYIITIIFACFIHKKILFLYEFSISFELFTFKELFPLWGTQIINSMFASLPYVIFPLFFSIKEIGFFAVAHRLFGISSTLILVLSSYFSPLFSKNFIQNNKVELISLYNKSRWLSFAIFLPLTFLVLFYTEHVLKLFGSELSNSIVASIVTIFFLVRQFSLLFGLTENFLYMTGRGHIELISSSISIIFGLLVLLCIEDTYGLLVSSYIFIFFYTLRILLSYAYLVYKDIFE